MNKAMNQYEYNTANELLNLTEKYKVSIGEIALQDSANDYGLGTPYVVAQMQKRITVIENSIKEGLKIETRSKSGLSGGDAKKLNEMDLNKSVVGEILHDAIKKSFAVTESNAANRRIVAFPTAGSSGVVPGALFALYEKKSLSQEKLINGMFAAGAIGIIVAKNAMIAGATGGCQAEVGTAGAMAAAGLAEMLGLTAQQGLDAAAITLKGMLGLVCDPIAGLVECPCIKRNSMALANAYTAIEMVSAGIQSNVPLDEVIGAMERIGNSMNPKYKETSKGGIAVTETGKKIWNRLFSV